ncbi:TIR domain-containing protein [Bacillus safensis]|uniref:TIR domain-containing protein n=1 Tax=Bacillus safensis TaxID=561879 RepID=UPI00249714DA|nr:TIR domain-containing protein [Bacillus safensis]GMG78149.1 hypothetical protein ShirakiTA10_11110 [Bacillus safensis]
MTKKIFISYDYDNDKTYKNMLVAWSKNNTPNFKDIQFEDGSTDVSVNSTDTGAIRRAISRRMNTCGYFLLLVGEDTHKSSWCDWEIDKAKELGMKLVAVKINNSNTSSIGILNSKAKWAKSFTKEAIKKAIDEA